MDNPETPATVSTRRRTKTKKHNIDNYKDEQITLKKYMNILKYTMWILRKHN